MQKPKAPQHHPAPSFRATPKTRITNTRRDAARKVVLIAFFANVYWFKALGGAQSKMRFTYPISSRIITIFRRANMTCSKRRAGRWIKVHSISLGTHTNTHSRASDGERRTSLLLFAVRAGSVRIPRLGLVETWSFSLLRRRRRSLSGYIHRERMIMLL